MSRCQVPPTRNGAGVNLKWASKSARDFFLPLIMIFGESWLVNPPADEGRDRNISGEIREKRRNAKAASVGWSAVVWLKLGHENTGGQKTQTHPDIGTQTRQKGVDDRRLPHCCCCCVVPLLFCCSVLSATFRCPKTRKKKKPPASRGRPFQPIGAAAERENPSGGSPRAVLGHLWPIISRINGTSTEEIEKLRPELGSCQLDRSQLGRGRCISRVFRANTALEPQDRHLWQWIANYGRSFIYVSFHSTALLQVKTNQVDGESDESTANVSVHVLCLVSEDPHLFQPKRSARIIDVVTQRLHDVDWNRRRCHSMRKLEVCGFVVRQCVGVCSCIRGLSGTAVRFRRLPRGLQKSIDPLVCLTAAVCPTLARFSFGPTPDRSLPAFLFVFKPTPTRSLLLLFFSLVFYFVMGSNSLSANSRDISNDICDDFVPKWFSI